jgi:hypothetical protein
MSGEGFAFACWARWGWQGIQRTWGMSHTLNAVSLSMWRRGERE